MESLRDSEKRDRFNYFENQNGFNVYSKSFIKAYTTQTESNQNTISKFKKL